MAVRSVHDCIDIPFSEVSGYEPDSRFAELFFESTRKAPPVADDSR
jgi:hypothetical protein